MAGRLCNKRLDIYPSQALHQTVQLQDNGLKLSNSWSGYHIVLNPDFSANVQWRFVNRAIDEVENQRVSLLAVCLQRNVLTTYGIAAQSTEASKSFS